jgi:hypothetical protein
MLKLELLKGQTKYDLTNAVDYVLQAFDSLALPPVTNLTQQGPYQVGVTLVGTRIEARTIPITLHVFGHDEQQYWERRRELNRMLTPFDGMLTLRLRRDGFVTRCLDCVYDGGLTLSSAERRQFGQLAAFSLLAPDPIWYDPAIVSVTFALSGGGAPTEVPTPVETPVGASIIDETRSITYLGEWYTRPIIRVYGPIDDLIINNLTTGEKLDFSEYVLGSVVGTSIGAGEWLEIDCRTNQITDQAGVNRIAWLSETSHLATFHLAAAPEAPGGVNVLRVQGDNVAPATHIDVTYYNRYPGV